MKNLRLLPYLLMLCGVSQQILAKRPVFHTNLNAGHQPNQLIVKVKPDWSSKCIATAINLPEIQHLMSSIGVTACQKKFPNHKPANIEHVTGGKKIIDLSSIYTLHLNGIQSLEKCISVLLNSGYFVYAEPNYTQKLLYTPNDPSIALQYYLDKISAYQAWDISKSDTNIVVGITDTGTDLVHEDVIDNIKYNYLDPIDGADNDMDGYTDNYYGWDLGENDNSPQCNANFHGLHSTGISSATADNNIGIAGVGFSAKFLPVKISDAAGILNTSYEGIVYAADHGCDIINCSWGGDGGGQFGQDIIDYAVFNKNCLVVASAGNNGNDVLFYPASYDNVLNVAATDQTDHKKANSTYGITIDVCAPGEDIYSTWTGNSYTASGGTSTAGPVVAGAAAIVKKHYPQYNALQIGEQLKVTCDVIDTIPFNSPWAGKLGHGRINLYRALTETHPSYVLTADSITDHNDNAFVIGDSLRIFGEFTNYLEPSSGAVTVSISTISPYVALLDSQSVIGTLNTLQSANNLSDPFLVSILAGTPQNAVVEFKVRMTDAGGNMYIGWISVTLNVDYINYTINEVYTTLTSRGNAGYNAASQTGGLGFVYNGNNLLYEGGLMIGDNATLVSDKVRGVSGQDQDFVSVSNIAVVDPPLISDFETMGIFNDAGAAASALPVKVIHKGYAWSNTPNEKFIIIKYQIINTGLASLNNIHAGMFADWDIMNSALNKAAYDATNKMGYVFSTQGGSPYAGIKLLSNNSLPVHYAMDNIAGGGGGVDPTGGISTAEKFTMLSTNRPAAGGAGSGNDVIDVMSTGPIQIQAGDTAEVAFALIAGNDLADLQNSAAAAQWLYNGNPVGSAVKPAQTLQASVFPNPVNNLAVISLSTIRDVHWQLSDMSGKNILSGNSCQSAQFTLDCSQLCEGAYILSLVSQTEAPLYYKIFKN